MNSIDRDLFKAIHKGNWLNATIFLNNPSCSDLFCTGRFDFVIYQRDYSNRKKNKICRGHGFELIRVENSYARRYNFIKNILIDCFGKRRK